jgi:hypothetical protein
MMSKLEDSVEEMKKTLNGQIGRIEELEETAEKLSYEKGSSNKFRKLHTKKDSYKDRNICYAKDDSIIDVVSAKCYASFDDDWDAGYASCFGGSRRVLTDDESRRNLQEMRGKRDLCSYDDDFVFGGWQPGYSAGDDAVEFGKLDIGAIQIGEE